MRGKGHVYSFEEQKLVKVGVRNLLNWLNVITGNELVVRVENSIPDSLNARWVSSSRLMRDRHSWGLS